MTDNPIEHQLRLAMRALKAAVRHAEKALSAAQSAPDIEVARVRATEAYAGLRKAMERRVRR